MSLEWSSRAECRNKDPELFFPASSTGAALRQIEEAKQVCRRYPVQVECLQFALETGQDFGIWGGTTEDERRALKRNMSTQPTRLGAAALANAEAPRALDEEIQVSNQYGGRA